MGKPLAVEAARVLLVRSGGTQDIDSAELGSALGPERLCSRFGGSDGRLFVFLLMFCSRRRFGVERIRTLVYETYPD